MKNENFPLELDITNEKSKTISELQNKKIIDLNLIVNELQDKIDELGLEISFIKK